MSAETALFMLGIEEQAKCRPPAEPYDIIARAAFMRRSAGVAES